MDHYYISYLFVRFIFSLHNGWDDVLHDKAFQSQYNIINSAFYILKNILLSVAMLMKTAPVKIKFAKNNDWDNDLLSYKLKK